jgi:hypothetical protein
MNKSLTATLTVVALLCSTSASFAALLSVDINDRSSTDVPDTAPGFSAYILTGTTAATSASVTQSVNGYSVTLAAFDDGLDENSVTAGIQNGVGQIDDRDRATPTNGGALTYGQLYDDLIFAGGTTGPTGGMNVTVSGGSLLANTQYQISIYAYDSGSNVAPQPRSANWYDGNNANALVLTTSFDGTVLPTTDSQYRFTGLAATDATGALLLLGRNTTPNAVAGGVSIGVVLNGFEINVPEPTSLSLLALATVPALRRRRRSA